MTGVGLWGLAALAACALAASPARAESDACGAWKPGGERAGSLEYDALDESSGLASSGIREGIFWTHNDSGGKPNLYALADDGDHRGVVTLGEARARDWEDIAVGPCRAGEPDSCLYVADIGDNTENHESVEILRFPEVLPEDAGRRTVADYTRIPFRYAGGPRNAETLMVHPESAAIYVVEKSNTESPGLYRIPNAAADAENPHVVERTAELDLPGAVHALTAGDVAPDGRSFSVRSYLKIFTFCAPADEPFERAFQAEPVGVYPRFTLQSEALGYGAEGDSLWFSSERRPAPLIRMQQK